MGTEVVSLQSILIEKGYLTMPKGVPMGYFGPLTKKALAMYQMHSGIRPTSGYFGPITRAYINAN